MVSVNNTPHISEFPSKDRLGEYALKLVLYPCQSASPEDLNLL